MKTRVKKAVKLLVDAAMLCLFLNLMGYQVVRGLMNHTLGGIALFALFFLHHLLNLPWYRTLFKGRYPIRRVLLTASDFLLLIAMILMAVSSVMMSSSVFSFSHVPLTQLGHDLHVCSTAWGYILMALHLGLHTHAPLDKLRRRLQDSVFEYVWYLALMALICGGIYAFVRSGLWSDLFLLRAIKTPFSDFRIFCMIYEGVLLGICLMTHTLLILLVRAGKKQRLTKRGIVSDAALQEKKQLTAAPLTGS